MLTYLNALQGARYVELAELRAANEDFMLGWAPARHFHFPPDHQEGRMTPPLRDNGSPSPFEDGTHDPTGLPPPIAFNQAMADGLRLGR